MKTKSTKSNVDLTDVYDVLRAQKNRSLHVMEIAARLGLDPSQRDEVRDLLDELKERGAVQELPGLRFRSVKPPAAGHGPVVPAQAVQSAAPPANLARSAAPRKESPSARPAHGKFSAQSDRRDERKESRAERKPAPTAKLGTLRIHARGHGFVKPEDGTADIFIAPSELLGALHGDKVAVSARRSEKGFEGTVIAVLERGQKHVAGLLSMSAKGLVIEPSDARLPKLVHVVGRVPGDAVPGIAVVGEIVRYPDDGSAPEARVVRVLGVEGSAEVEVAKIKLREGIREEFPEAVIEEAQAFGDRVSAKDKRDREDLRDFDLVTIDPITARDHDDAIFIERGAHGGYRIIVAIADVSHYIREGSALDAEAIERSTSIYLPDRAIPMLPHEISTNLASLVAGKDRLTLAVDMQLTSQGVVKSFRYVEGLMRCKAGLTYEGVAQALGFTKEGRNEKAAVRLLPMLETLHEAAMTLRARRMKRGSLDFDLPEPNVELDEKTGEPKNITRRGKDPGVRKAYQLVEEMMLLANETVAADLYQREVPGIYRVHGLPDAERLEQFASSARAMGHALELDDGASPKELGRFLAGLEDSPSKGALSYLLLRSMQQATYDTVNIGHFGLAAEYYLHFTSPIRRYPDLAVHRVVRKLARGEPIDARGLEHKLSEQAGNASKLERRAMLVEREVVDVYRCILVKDRVGEEFEGTVSGVAPHGVYVGFDDPFVECLCHVTSLGTGDFYEIDPHGLRLVGRRSGASFGLGDRLTVRLDSVNVAERSIVGTPIVFPQASELHNAPKSADGGHKTLTRKQKDRARGEGKSSWGKHHPPAEKKTERKQERKQERRRDRRGKDSRKQKR
ncbi:MAG: 3-to-5 exoribonuclease RNase [Myxococcaceae bacterium]|nr:3-to-5 exoribonuclease RNase [Myxococcaceae bacterium]